MDPNYPRIDNRKCDVLIGAFARFEISIDGATVYIVILPTILDCFLVFSEYPHAIVIATFHRPFAHFSEVRLYG